MPQISSIETRTESTIAADQRTSACETANIIAALETSAPLNTVPAPETSAPLNTVPAPETSAPFKPVVDSEIDARLKPAAAPEASERFEGETKSSPMAQTIYERFRARVEEDPQAVAAIDANEQVTRAELDRRAGEVAASLPASARRVGIAMQHGIAQIAAILGVLRSGAAYVPVEPDFPLERIRYMMENAQVECVITDRGILPIEVALAELDPARRGRALGPTHVQAPDTIPDLARDTMLEATYEAGLAYILYTSGTTGKPKGVMVTNANVCNYIDAFAAEFHPTSADTMLQYSVCSFDIFVEEVFSALLSGMTLAIPSPRDKANTAALMDFVDRTHVSLISGFPYLFQEMNELDAIPFSLRLLISGGDVLRARYVDRLIDLVDVYNTYGPSETTVCASYCRCNATPALADGTYPVGRSVRGVQARIMNDAVEEVPAGEVGEIVITGRGVGLGYVGDPPEQANFVTLADGTRAYRSGDVGYMLPDGQIAFMHRKDTQVMIDGRRVEPTEVESVLCTCPEVEAGVVRSEVDADQMPYLVGYYVPVNDGGTMSANAAPPAMKDVWPDCGTSSADVPGVEFACAANAAPPTDDAKMEALLREEMSHYLASYMLPEYFVKMDHLPLTPNGKVDTRALPHVERA